MRKYNTAEQGIVIKSQLYTLEQQYKSQPGIIEAIGDIIPGVVLINNYTAAHNIYMNGQGSDFLKKEPEELWQLGLGYFGDNFFCEEEMAWIIQHFGGVIERNDNKEVTSFYQKVRPDKKTDWSYFHLSGKLLESQPGCCIYMGIKINQANYTLHNVNKALNIEPPKPVAFQKFMLLTRREKEILGLIARGYTNTQIGDILFLSTFTVETHRKNIRRKLEAKSLSDLIRVADRFDL